MSDPGNNLDFRRALESLQNGMHGKARKLFERAATSGLMEARLKLSYFSLYGKGGAELDVEKAREGFQACAELGSGEAHYWCATLMLCQESFDREKFHHHLQIALKQEYPPALLVQGVMENHVQSLRRASALGEPISTRLLNDREQWGKFGPTGQNVFLPDTLSSSASRISQEQKVAVLDLVLSPLQCLFLRRVSEPTLHPAMVVDPRTNQSIRSPLRTNSATTLLPERSDLTIRLLERKIAAAAGFALSVAEPLSVLRYQVGEEYKPHRDYLADPSLTAAHTPGQRIGTAFCYLNDVELGGETQFLHWNKRVNPKTGRIVIFHNCNADGSPDSDSVHAGLPVLAGEKWLATLWFRQRTARSW